MAKSQVLPVIGKPPGRNLRVSESSGIGGRSSGAGVMPGGPDPGGPPRGVTVRNTTSVPDPTPARMKAGKGISNGVKPGRQRTGNAANTERY
jgi:hypothetical protein